MQKSLLLEILIPTLNREHALIINLQRIHSYIKKYNCETIVGVIISDNCSESSSFNDLSNFLETSYSCLYKLFRQEANIGIEKNTLFLLGKATAKYVMTLGDDDYFSEGFFKIMIDYLKEGKVRCVIPNFYTVDANGNRHKNFYRDPITTDKYYDSDSLWISERGHQLSCISFMREGVLETYNKNVRPNLYPFIYFIAFNLTKGEAVHVTREPFANTLISKKNWDYSFDNLMGEISCVVDCLPYKNEDDKKKQAQKIIKDNAGRYCNIPTFAHPIKIMRRIKAYDASDLIKKLLRKRYYIQLLKFPITLPYRVLRKICRVIKNRVLSKKS